MAKLTPQQHAALWASRFGASGQRYKDGVSSAKRNPMQAAIAQQQVMLNNYTAAITSGKWAAKLGAVNLQTWVALCHEGAANFGRAATAKVMKVEKAEADNARIRDAVIAGLPARGDIQANLERARLMAIGMHEAALRGRPRGPGE